MAVTYETKFASLQSYEKGGVQAIDDDVKHYAFSNCFEIANNGAVLVAGTPQGAKMGWMKLKRGHQGMLPKNTAYQFKSATPGVLVMQTCKGGLSVEKWADICQTA